MLDNICCPIIPLLLLLGAPFLAAVSKNGGKQQLNLLLSDFTLLVTFPSPYVAELDHGHWLLGLWAVMGGQGERHLFLPPQNYQVRASNIKARLWWVGSKQCRMLFIYLFIYLTGLIYRTRAFVSYTYKITNHFHNPAIPRSNCGWQEYSSLERKPEGKKKR